MTGISLSIPILDSNYVRSFDAEIGVLTEDEILVRGRMRDHRCEFEHVWRVRTPDYEVIEAAAEQLAGEPSQFDPALCARYAGIRGVGIGRGFSKRIVAELGDLPGAQEHLFLAIEMARISQQVYQFPPEFESQFATICGDSEAHTSWRKDRAYMADLANSCYTYRDESDALFASRDVRLGFGGDLYTPKPGDKRVFWRGKQLSIAVENDRFVCESAMDDRIHDIRIGFDLSSEGVISNAHSCGLRLPYHGICEDAQLRTAGLDGMRVGAGFILQFANRVGGSQGCTHLFDLSIDVLRLFQFDQSRT
ncbi:MAG: DUF2889 domain-containing protein, partial [Gammaproteobacteria bacterium]